MSSSHEVYTACLDELRARGEVGVLMHLFVVRSILRSEEISMYTRWHYEIHLEVIREIAEARPEYLQLREALAALNNEQEEIRPEEGRNQPSDVSDMPNGP